MAKENNKIVEVIDEVKETEAMKDEIVEETNDEEVEAAKAIVLTDEETQIILRRREKANKKKLSDHAKGVVKKVGLVAGIVGGVAVAFLAGRASAGGDDDYVEVESESYPELPVSDDPNINDRIEEVPGLHVEEF